MIITLEILQEIQVWWPVSVISTFGKWRQKEPEFKVTLGYVAISRTFRANETLS